MRWDAGTLRVICLVASAVSAGYLWRAALEGDNELQRLLDTAPPAIVEDKSDRPTRSGPSLAGLAPDRLVPTGTAPDRPVEPKARPAARAKSAGAAKPARPTAREAPQRPSSRPGRTTPAPTGGGAAPPRPPRTPPAPAPGSSGPKRPPGGPSAPPPPPKPPPAPPVPTPAPEPPPTPSPPAPVVEPGEPSVATPSEQRPGWGSGDKNHEHTGPPGKRTK